jgi:hypothetical protein
MRYLVTLLFAALSFNAYSQNNSIHVYPWNPDADQNNQIGSGDLLPFLSVFGEEFGLPPEPCTYDGTSIEDFFIGIQSGLVILDSVYLEYELEDVSSFYIGGCPELYTDTILYAWSGNCYANYVDGAANWFKFELCDLNLIYSFGPSSGQYQISLRNDKLHMLGFSSDGFFGNYNAQTSYTSIPWPNSWIFDENGISVEISSTDPWTDYANYLHILPYWHYADE